MDAREERGLAIAAKYNLTKKGDAWLVPSQSENGEKYTVIPGTKCSCPDHKVRQVKCKHIWAVEYVLERETAQDGTVTETVKVTKVTQKTYPQNWTTYNAAQSEGKTRFGVLLADLCRGIQQPIREGRGRPALPLADMLFASAKFDALADATDNLHERGFWARAQEQMARYAATLAYVRTLEEGIP